MSEARGKSDKQNDRGGYQALTERVGTAYQSARERVGEATAGIEANPVALVLGGIAAGVVAGALIPTSERERAVLEPLGQRLNEAARAALEAGREAGGAALNDAGLDPQALRGQATQLVNEALKAAGQAGSAALSAARDAATSR